jgi:hypothetical protein
MTIPPYILWPDRPEIRDNCLRAIEALPVEVVWDVQVKKHVNSKTVRQRNWFHQLCELFGAEIGLDKGVVKEIAKAQKFGWRTVKYGGIELVLADGHSENLNAREYFELTEILYRLAAEAGVVLPEPVKQQETEK